MTEKRFATLDEAETEADALNAETGEDEVYSPAFVNSYHGDDYWIVERNER